MNNTRQENILMLVIEEYISTGHAVSSGLLMKKYKLEYSSATIRNELSHLEKDGYIEKPHTSGGRIPSTKGYQFYANKVKNKSIDKDIKKALSMAFAKRIVGVENVIEEAADIISNLTDFTIMTTSSEGDELLKSIQYVPLNETNATIVLVTSTGRVESKLVNVKYKVELDDIRIAIRIFKERLIDTPISQLSAKAEALAPILKNEINEYENTLQKIVNNVFDFHLKQIKNVHGRTNIIKQNDVISNPKKLMKILSTLEEQSIWKIIENDISEEENLKIDISSERAILSKKIQVNNISKEISIIGSNRMEYNKALPILKYIEKIIQEGSK